MLSNKKATPQEIQLIKEKYVQDSVNDGNLAILTKDELTRIADLFMIFANQRTFRVKITDIKSQAQLLQLDSESTIFSNILEKMIASNKDPVDFKTFITSYCKFLGNTNSEEGLNNIFTTATVEDSIDQARLVKLGEETEILLDLTSAEQIVKLAALDQQGITREDLGNLYKESELVKPKPSVKGRK